MKTQKDNNSFLSLKSYESRYDVFSRYKIQLFLILSFIIIIGLFVGMHIWGTW